MLHMRPWWYPDMSVYVSICHLSQYTFVRTRRIYNSRNETQCKLWALGWKWCIGKFISCHKRTALAGDVDYGEAMDVWGLRVWGKSPYLPFNFAVNWKLLSKKKSLIKKDMDLEASLLEILSLGSRNHSRGQWEAREDGSKSMRCLENVINTNDVREEEQRGGRLKI